MHAKRLKMLCRRDANVSFHCHSEDAPQPRLKQGHEPKCGLKEGRRLMVGTGEKSWG